MGLDFFLKEGLSKYKYIKFQSKMIRNGILVIFPILMSKSYAKWDKVLSSKLNMSLLVPCPPDSEFRVHRGRESLRETRILTLKK